MDSDGSSGSCPRLPPTGLSTSTITRVGPGVKAGVPMDPGAARMKGGSFPWSERRKRPRWRP